MKRLALAPVLALAVLGATGCTPRSTYRVHAVSREAVSDKLDGTWFEREVFDKEGLAAVELTYCPVVPKADVVCRTAIVWKRDRSELLAK